MKDWGFSKKKVHCARREIKGGGLREVFALKKNKIKMKKTSSKHIFIIHSCEMNFLWITV